MSKIDLCNPVIRYEGNPILTSNDVNKIWTNPIFQTITVHNAGITEYNNEVIMLFRSHLRNGISILGIARSKNGLDNWIIDKTPAMIPCTKNDDFAESADINEVIENEQGGIEDPRISKIGDLYYITYSAYHASIAHRVRVSLAITKDFKSFKRYGPLLKTDMRNVVIFPEKINNKYYGLFRPNDKTQAHTNGIYKQIRIGYTRTIENGNWNIIDKPIFLQNNSPSSFSDKIGPGATPLKTKHGWINIFHGVRSTMDGHPYVLGVALHELQSPEKVKVSNIPILFPTKVDCKVTDNSYVHVPNVVFCCGAIRKHNGDIYIYYGGNDTVMNVAITHEDILAELCEKYPQDPQSGRPLYEFIL
ncbi:glycosidase [Flavobacteriaceae bacterium PRS1]|nr:glycosidase [Flavobacteriaceae bacterium PRS1]